MIHLIFSNLTFNEKFKDFFQNENYHPQNNKDYQTLAIIGCQSSGKSTLLNHLFNSQFEVMSDDKGRGQTTQGIWTFLSREYDTIVFDVEGTDAKERGDDRFKFEQCSSLFALAMADVLLINMWTSDIGRYTASNYGVLKIVFEQNLKLFQQESEKKIVIVLRDFEETVDDVNKLRESILSDIKNIWNEIKKPEKFKNDPPEKYFKFDFITLPHKFYKKEQFLAEIENIKTNYLKKNNNNKKTYFFNHVNIEKNVPIDGFYLYTRDMWSTIINNKDLNIPNQKEMLAQFRCNEIKENALNEINDKISDLEYQSSLKNIENYKEKVNEIKENALKIYDETAKEYLTYIYEEIRKNLINEISNKFYPSFLNQLKRLIPSYQKNFRIELENELKSNDNFSECAKNTKKIFIEKIENELNNLKVFENWEIGENNQSIFDEIIEDQKEKVLKTKKKEINKKVRNLIEDSLLTHLEEIQNNFWIEINQDVLQSFITNLLNYKLYLMENYELNENEFLPFVQELENEIYSDIKIDFKKKSKEIANFQTENFRNKFWYEDGVPRIWNQINESKIKELFNKAKEGNKENFDLFKIFKIIKNPLNLIDYNKDIKEEDLNKINNEKIVNILNENNNNNENNFEELLNEKEIETLKNKYDENINEIYEDALRRHNNIKQTSIPLWAWILLIYVSYKDIYDMITGHAIIYIIIIVGIFGVLNFLGLGKVPSMVFNMIVAQVQSTLGIKKNK